MAPDRVLRVKKLREDAKLPAYANHRDAGLDLFSCEDVTIPPGSSQLVPTGIAVELPPGTEGQIRPRSGLALDKMLTVLNSPGTIDEGFRGEIGVVLLNLGKEPARLDAGTRIAQMVVSPVLRVDVREVEALSETPRGENGFGSTGSGDTL